MVNQWNFTLSSVTSCQIHGLSVPNLLWLMLPALQHAVILPVQFKCQASVSVATSSHTESVTPLYQHNHPGRPTHRNSWLELVPAPSLKGEGRGESGESCFVASNIDEGPPPLPTTTREEESRPGAGALAARKICGVAPPFSLGWDKPGSVAPLRLVGCLIETPAPSWAYFYSAYFFLPYTDLSSRIFSILRFSLLCFLFILLYPSSMLLTCVSVSMRDWTVTRNLQGLVSNLDPNIVCFFSPISFLLVFICYGSLPRWRELRVTAWAVSMQWMCSCLFASTHMH